MLLVRGMLAVAMVALGGVILTRMLALVPAGRLTVIPGVVLGAAMIALGVHRLALIARARGTP
jgi:hypothetical protein